jgi:DNA polymerase V
VFVQTNKFCEKGARYYNNKTIALPVATNSDIELIKYAEIALKAIYKPGYQYKKSGVLLAEIIPENQIPYDLLDTIDRKKHHKLMDVIDGLSSRFNRDIVIVATQGNDKSWHLRCEHKGSVNRTVSVGIIDY